jgi:hypothetical protein
MRHQASHSEAFCAAVTYFPEKLFLRRDDFSQYSRCPAFEKFRHHMSRPPSAPAALSELHGNLYRDRQPTCQHVETSFWKGFK